jgi:hypothetical protein
MAIPKFSGDEDEGDSMKCFKLVQETRSTNKLLMKQVKLLR